MGVDESKLETIRNLLAKAERTGNAHEREAYREKAMKLIAKYGVDEALLASKSGNRTVADREIIIHTPFPQPKMVLLHQLANALGVETIFGHYWKIGRHKRAGQKDRQVQVAYCFGREGDLDRLELLFTSLLAQQLTEFARIDYDDPMVILQMLYENCTKQQYRRNWLIAYAMRVGERLEDLMRGAAEEAGAGTELVLADMKALAASAAKARFPDTYESTTRAGRAGALEGREAAERADIGQDKLDDEHFHVNELA